MKMVFLKSVRLNDECKTSVRSTFFETIVLISGNVVLGACEPICVRQVERLGDEGANLLF